MGLRAFGSATFGALIIINFSQMPNMKKNFLFLSLLFFLGVSYSLQAQIIPGDSIVYGPMMSPPYNNKVRVWVLTKNNTGSGNALSISMSENAAPGTLLTGTAYNSDTRLGYNLRSFEYTNLLPGGNYTAKVMVNGVASNRVATIRNEQEIIDDFEFLSGGCGRIYDLSRCIDIPESATHINGDPNMFNVMAQEGSDMMVWLGDAVYLLGLQHAMGQCPDGVDDWANKDMAFARYMFYRDFHDNLTKAMPQLAITDNHDTGPNEFNKTMPTLGEMKEIFKDWWPNPEYKSTPEGPGLFSSYKYKDVEYFLLDNRSYRDGTLAHLGPDQMVWLKGALLASTAKFKVLINGTPSFERNCGGRNFCATTQSAELVNYIRDNNINGVLSLSADIHEQKFMIREGSDVKYPLYDILSGNLNSDIGNGQHNVNYGSDYLMTGVKQTYLRINVFGAEDDRRMKVEYVGPTGVPYFETIIHEDMLTSQNADALKLQLDMSNSITDASTYNHVITATDVAYVNDREGLANEAVSFGQNTSVSIPSALSLNFHNRPFSLAFWVKPEAFQSNGSTIISNGSAGTGVSFGLDANGKLTYKDHATNTTYTSQYSLLPHTWAYIVWKYDNVRRKLSLYYNGFVIQSWTNVISPVASASEIKVGNNFEGKKFIGALDKLVLYGRIISDEAILTEADFETTRGEVLKVAGAPQMAIPGSVINPLLANNFTIQFWAKLNGDPGTNFKMLASNGRVNGNSTGISFEFPDSNKLNVVIGNNGSGWNTISEQGAAWNVGEWNQVTVTAVNNGQLKYYVNGEFVAQTNFTQYVGNSWGLGLGYSPAYTGAVQAELDELRIWQKALTPEEIKQTMHYALEGTEENLALYYDFAPTTEGANTITSKGSVPHVVTLNGGTLAPATSPVAVMPADYQTTVKGKWSKNNAMNAAGLSMPDNITNYASNVVVGKKNDATLDAVPGSSTLSYAKGGWKIDPVSTPFASVKMNLSEVLATKFDSVANVAGKYYLLKKESDTSYLDVSEGDFDGQNVTFHNANLTEGEYFLGWDIATFSLGRGGALSLTGGHVVTIPKADINPTLSGEFTLEFWVNMTQDPGSNTPLVSNHGRVNNNTTGLSIEMPDNNSVSAVFGTNTNNWNNINSGTQLIVGEWNHVAVTAKPGENIKLYLNGELKATSAYTGFVTNTNWDFAIGKSINYNSQTISKMDEFRIWNKVKTAEEIKAQMHYGIKTTDNNLVYNLTFDQEDNGIIDNTGTQVNDVTYTSAQIIDATSPVADLTEAFPKVTGNWSIKNETDNGLYVKADIDSFSSNLIAGRNTDSTVLPLGTVENTSYVKGGWNLNALSLETATLQADLSKIFANPTQIDNLAEQFMLIKGDPESNYQTVATGVSVDGKIDFENVALTSGNYYLAFETDVNSVIAQQGGTLELGQGHEVLIPKEGVNQALSGPFTIELWGRLTQTAGANTKLVGFTSLTGGNFGWEMEFLDNQTLQTIMGKGASGGWNSLNSTKVWAVNEWNHAAVTYTPNGEFKFYINGELMSSMPVTHFTPNANNLALGKNVANNSPTRSTIDEFRIWTKAKTIEEIREDMYLTMPEATANLPYNYTFNQDDNGFIVNSGSQQVEVAYTNAHIIPATAPVRDMEAPFRNKVTGNWSVKNDDRNGLFLADVITSKENNVVIGKQLGGEVLHILNETANDTLYLSTPWKMASLYMDQGSPKADLSKIFTNLNDVQLIAQTYFLLKGNPAEALEIAATGTKVGNIVTFGEMPLDGTPVYLAWKNEPEYPVGSFPIAAQSIWKYNDSGADLGTDWRTNAYDDSAWLFGNGILGYGDPNQNTTLSYGADAQNKHITTYLRHTFNVEDASAIGTLKFKVLRDDGVVVYVNGVEAFRDNMPQGEITSSTIALAAVNDAAETTFYEFTTDNLLQTGENVIAVELHQAAANSSDLGFDMAVDFNLPPLAPAAYPLPKGSEWTYLDNGINQGTEWTNPVFNNTEWKKGIAPLGYGNPMNTVVSFGPDSANKYITTYFSRDIQINLSELTDMVNFGLRRDDGAVVYVNGTEVIRDNMPTGAIDYLTHSVNTIDGADEKRYYVYQVAKSAFVDGVNRISVEMHNRDQSSSDIGFDLYVQNTEDLTVSCDEPHIGCFTSIAPTAQQNHLIISGDHRFQLIFKEGTPYMTGGGNVPGNHDFAAYIGINGSSTNGYLSVNQENTPGGVSMLNLHLDETQDLWVVDNSRAVDLYNSNLVTTSRNCSGGVTPWGTIVTSEEDTASGDANGDGYQDLGWLIEIDPETAQVKEHGNGYQEKLWAMGRMNHENVVIAADQRTAYYGEDGGTHCVYKFVADTPGDLSAGKVYVLKLDLPLSDDEPSSATATWVQVPNATKADRNNLNTVASTLGGTNFNGVEDCEISPLNGMIYFTSKGKNRVYRFKDNGDTISQFEVFAGGKNYNIETANGTMSEPWADGNDNLTFDDKGNLWVLQDGGLNYIWVIRPDHEQSHPNIKLFASMPAGAEPTGLNFTPDFKYGFFSVQHPNGNNAAQQDATFGNVTFNASATVVFSLDRDLGAHTPVADFTANVTTIQEGETVTFTDLSTNNPTSWAWTFEGGEPATSTEASPTVTYNAPGTYNVSLITYNIAGTSAAADKADYILVEEVLGIDTPNPLKGMVTMYPNPTDGAVTIEVNNEAGNDVIVEVFDITGRKVSETKGQSIAGNQKVELNLSGVAGEQVFVVHVHVGDKTGTYKLLKKQ
ncbi:putative secreted protein (Por secretion system target) [Flavobacterium sp. AG291]|nr:putative secreted protein (Por secretion system target) [Flavobacterium sp. AG291]